MAFKDYSSLDKHSSPHRASRDSSSPPRSPSLIKPPTSTIGSVSQDRLHSRHDRYSNTPQGKPHRAKKRKLGGGGYQVKSSLFDREPESPQIDSNKRKSSIFNPGETSPFATTPSRKKKPAIYNKKRSDYEDIDGSLSRAKGYSIMPIEDNENDDDDDDDDDDFGIIDISKLSSISRPDVRDTPSTTKSDSIGFGSPIKQKVKQKARDNDNDNTLASIKQKGRDNDNDNTSASIKQNANFAQNDDNDITSDKDLFASTVLGQDGNILSNLHKNKDDGMDTIKQRFAHYNLPTPPTSRKALRARVLKHLDLIPAILRGKVESRYYTRARHQASHSPHQTMSKDEKWHIRWSDYVGGYYGLDRQHFINLVILSKWRKLIKSHETKSTVVQYWTPNDFSAYVLANEVIVRLVMEDLACRQSKAELVMDETTEYGTVVADAVPLEQDLDNGELFGKESKKFMRNIDDDENDITSSAEKPHPNGNPIKDTLNMIFSDDDSD